MSGGSAHRIFCASPAIRADAVEPGNDSKAHARATMDHLARLRPLPKIVVLQEAVRSQLETYLEELQNRTGLAWRLRDPLCAGRVDG